MTSNRVRLVSAAIGLAGLGVLAGGLAASAGTMPASAVGPGHEMPVAVRIVGTDVLADLRRFDHGPGHPGLAGHPAAAGGPVLSLGGSAHGPGDPGFAGRPAGLPVPVPVSG